MKNYIYLLCLFIFLACADKDENCIECNTKVENYISDKSTIKFFDFTNLDISQQKKIYNKLDSIEKKELWLIKMNQITSFEWTVEEKNYLKDIEEIIKNINFDNGLSDKDLVSLKELRDIGINEFGFTKRFFVAAFGYLNSINKEGFFITNKNGEPFIINPNEDPDCNCRWGFGCLDGPCDQREDVCKKSDEDCGWFWTQPCLGICKPELG